MKYKSISNSIKTDTYDADTAFIVQAFGTYFTKYILQQPKNAKRTFFDVIKGKVIQLDNKVTKRVKYMLGVKIKRKEFYKVQLTKNNKPRVPPVCSEILL